MNALYPLGRLADPHCPHLAARRNFFPLSNPTHVTLERRTSAVRSFSPYPVRVQRDHSEAKRQQHQRGYARGGEKKIVSPATPCFVALLRRLSAARSLVPRRVPASVGRGGSLHSTGGRAGDGEDERASESHAGWGFPERQSLDTAGLAARVLPDLPNSSRFTRFFYIVYIYIYIVVNKKNIYIYIDLEKK